MTTRYQDQLYPLPRDTECDMDLGQLRFAASFRISRRKPAAGRGSLPALLPFGRRQEMRLSLLAGKRAAYSTRTTAARRAILAFFRL